MASLTACNITKTNVCLRNISVMYYFFLCSWDEMAQYDFPSLINFALKKSGSSQLHYVGHSQGTLIAFAHLSKNSDLRSKIKSIFALGPVATVGYIKGALKPLSFFTADFAVSCFGLKLNVKEHEGNVSF